MSPPKISLRVTQEDQPYVKREIQPIDKKSTKKKVDESCKTGSHARQNSENLFMSDLAFGTQTTTQINEVKDDMRIRSSLDSFTIPSCEKLIMQSKAEKTNNNRLSEKPPMKSSSHVQHVKMQIGNSKIESKLLKRDPNESNNN